MGRGLEMEGGMGGVKRLDPKVAALRQSGTLNPRPEAVVDPLFAQGGFFDRRDLLQTKYEMLRRAGVDQEPVARCARAFGFSRQSFYEARAAFRGGGLPGLMRRKPGPRGAHKLTDEVIAFVEEQRRADASLRPAQLAQRIKKRFGRQVHPRTVERALRRREKGGW